MNLYGEFCSVPREQREMVVRNTVRSWFLSGKEIPESFEDARYDLLPTVRSRSFIEFTILQLTNEGNRGPNWPYQIVGDHLAVGLVYDLPQAMRSISQEDLDRLGSHLLRSPGEGPREPGPRCGSRSSWALRTGPMSRPRATTTTPRG